MALTPLLGTKQYNIVGSTIDLTNNSSGADSGKWVVRMTAPDGLYYYFNGNNASTFANPNIATTPDFTTITGTTSGSLPLDSNGNIQNGTYLFDMNLYNTTSSSLSSMTQQTVSFCYHAVDFKLTPTIDCINAKLTVTDETDYTFATSFIVGSSYTLSLSKDVLTGTLPNGQTVTLDSSYNQSFSLTGTGVTAIITTEESVIITNPLYAGAYTVGLTGELIWTTGTGTSAYNTALEIDETVAYTAACVGGVCDVKCGVASVESQYKLAKDTGDIKGAAELAYKLTLISDYLALFNLASKCIDTDLATYALKQVQAIGNFNSGCCKFGDNYLIEPYYDCDCVPVNMTFVYRQVPASATSTSDASSVAYNLGDQAYDANYWYIYVNNASWKRVALTTW